MTQLKTTYDDTQHCIAADTLKGKFVAMDCPYTGKGEELSPGNLLEAALAGCMLMSMGAVAKRDKIDLLDAEVEVELVGTPPPKIGYTAVNAVIRMPAGIELSEREKLERAADGAVRQMRTSLCKGNDIVPHAAPRPRHSERAAARLSLKLSRE